MSDFGCLPLGLSYGNKNISKSGLFIIGKRNDVGVIIMAEKLFIKRAHFSWIHENNIERAFLFNRFAQRNLGGQEELAGFSSGSGHKTRLKRGNFHSGLSVTLFPFFISVEDIFDQGMANDIFLFKSVKHDSLDIFKNFQNLD